MLPAVDASGQVRESDKVKNRPSTFSAPSCSVFSGAVEGYSSPNHEPAEHIPPWTNEVKTRNQYFQQTWYNHYPWLHYSSNLPAIVCFSCAKATDAGLLTLEKKAELAFVSDGSKTRRKVRHVLTIIREVRVIETLFGNRNNTRNPN